MTGTVVIVEDNAMNMKLLEQALGIDLLRQLKSDPRTAEVPVLAVTAFADPDSVSGFLKEGFNQVITKPISIRMLLDEVAQYCGE